jgi:hypothetical protein
LAHKSGKKHFSVLFSCVCGNFFVPLQPLTNNKLLKSKKMRHFLIICLSLLSVLSVGAKQWVLVSDVSQLQAGDSVVIACNSAKATAGALDAQKALLTAVTSVFSQDNDVIESLGEGTLTFTLGGSTGAWTFATEGQLLGATAARKVQFDSGTTTWTIVVASNGDATIMSTNTSCGALQYNVASPRFTCFQTEQAHVQLYRYGDEVPMVKLSYQGFPYKRTGCQYPSYHVGAVVTLSRKQPQNAEGKVVIAWMYNDQMYQPGGQFTMPATDVELVPKWGDPEEGIEAVKSEDPKAQKMLRDGRLIIVRDGKAYNIMGMIIGN